MNTTQSDKTDELRRNTMKAVKEILDHHIKSLIKKDQYNDYEQAIAALTAREERMVQEALVPKCWVTNHDAPEDNQKVSGPYTTMDDAARARELLERFEHHHNYWIERLDPQEPQR